MMRMRTRSGVGIVPAVILMAAGLASARFGQDPLADPGGRHGQPGFDEGAMVVDLSGPIEPGRLYLRVGVQDLAMRGDLRFGPADALRAVHRGVIALDGPMTPARERMLQQAGVVPGAYLPAFAWLTDFRAADAAALRRMDFVVWAGEYDDAWRLDPELGRRAGVSDARQALYDAGLIPVDVTLFEDVDPGSAAAELAALGAAVHFTDSMGGTHIVAATIAFEQLEALRSVPWIQYVEEGPDITLRNNNARWIVQSNQSGTFPLYTNGLRGEGQVVGILDTRVDRNHCSFSDTQPIGPLHRKILAYNASAGASSHGTHVAGTAVGDANSNANTRGVAYAAKLVYNLTPSYNETSIRNALITHHNQGARVHTNSWGDDSTTAYNSLARGFDTFSWDYEDSLCCLAVTNTSTLKNPENAKNLLAVGATNPTPNQHQHCTGGAGPTADQRRKPEVYAPGCSTNSSRSGTSCSTISESGTSMASPAVAGAGLLMRQYFVDGYYPTGVATPGNAFTPTGALVKAMLVNSATDMTGVSGYPSNLEGWGRILARDAMTLPGSSRQVVVRQRRNADGFTTGQQEDHQVQVLGSAQRLKVTMVFTDRGATAGASFTPINDLDLEVYSPSGTLYRGNVFSGGSSTTGGSRDDRNNVEQVHLNSPPVGTWTIRVRAHAVNQLKQGYALVVSGQIEDIGSEPPPPPPANNACAAAQVVGAGSHGFTTISATTDGPDEVLNCTSPTLIQQDIWFLYAPDCGGNVTISLCDVDYDARIAVYFGGSCPTQPGQNVVACGTGCATQIVLPGSVGLTYLIRVGGNGSATGSGTLVIECEAPPPPSCPTDIDGSGTTDFNDLLALLSAWGPCPGGCPADIDGNGTADFNDLLALLSAWGPCD